MRGGRRNGDGAKGIKAAANVEWATAGVTENPLTLN